MNQGTALSGEWLCCLETSVVLGNVSCSFLSVAASAGPRLWPVIGMAGEAEGVAAATSGCRLVPIQQLTFCPVLWPRRVPGSERLLPLEAIKQLDCVGEASCLLFISFVFQELLLRCKQVDQRGSQPGKKAGCTDSPTPKSSTAPALPWHAFLQEGQQRSASCLFK